MTLEKIRGICEKLPAVTMDIKWENHLCFNVGEKMFLITSPDSSPVTASIKVSDEAFSELIELEGCSPAPYLARYKWIFIDDINRFNEKMWTYIINEAYELISAKLPRKVKKEIGIS